MVYTNIGCKSKQIYNDKYINDKDLQTLRISTYFWNLNNSNFIEFKTIGALKKISKIKPKTAKKVISSLSQK